MPSEKPSPDSARPSTTRKEASKIERRSYGIWEAVYLKGSGQSLRTSLNDFASGSEIYYRLLKDVYAITPSMTIVFVVCKFWASAQEALLLQINSNLLRMIETGMLDGEIDREGIAWAIIVRILASLFVAWFKWWLQILEQRIRSQVTRHYDIELLRARMGLDLSSSSEDPTKGSGAISSETPWKSFDSLVEFSASVTKFLSQFVLLFNATRASGGPLFVLLSMLPPLQETLQRHNMWGFPLLAAMTNKFYSRMQALKELTKAEYKHEYIAGNLSEYILKEYEKASRSLGSTPVGHLFDQLGKETSPYGKMRGAFLGDLPMAYCAWIATTNPSKLSLASIAILQQSTNTIQSSMHSIMYTFRNYRRNFTQMKNFYAAKEIQPRLKEGDTPYPHPKDENLKGMSIELRGVKFDYPSSQSVTSALKGISIFIKAGHIVVIVGANGSGKSTLVKLITRMYDATSGDLFIDGLPAADYKASNLRQTIASFTQDHKIFPLSLYENIALGNPNQIEDRDAVMKAAQLGGAADFIANLEDGANSVLDPMNDCYLINVPSEREEPDHPLRKEMKSIQKKVDVSGGERQRLVAARTFMHINSGRVKLVAVDEPSSALDPEAELGLFQRLIEAKEGKTMVFVTHRFGHLTKYADMIVCMKEGEVVETGSHRELMNLQGEYAKLYNIQADAFNDVKADPTST